MENEKAVQVCLGVLHIPYLAAQWPVYTAMTGFLEALTSSKEGILLFASQHESANLIVQSLFASS